jgi:alkanesulfonate monooxygenase SsuD/methylene tetrahydromethanopterin reductase-like flavin-dependent oxidoreductase (luciferase family)
VRMDFGTFLLLQSPSAERSETVFARGVEITQAADELGFRSMWLAEHHFSTYGYLSRPLTFAMHLANKTKRLRIGTAVIVLPLHHPLIVAEEIATVDILSGGRLDVGLGRGYQNYEFERLGVKLNESRKRWEEEVDIILLALTGKPFTYEGDYYQIPETTVFPSPIQQPHPPIWVTAQSLESVEATVRRGFNVITGGSGVPIERLREFKRALDEHLVTYAPQRPIHVGTQRFVYVTDNEADARAAAEQARWNMRVTLSLRNDYSKVDNGHAIDVPLPNEPTTEAIMNEFTVIGTPDQCIKQVRRLQDVMGIDHFNCSFWFGDLKQQQILKSMRLFAEEVMPAFKDG